MLPAHLRPPLWARWVLSLGAGLILLLALIAVRRAQQHQLRGDAEPGRRGPGQPGGRDGGGSGSGAPCGRGRAGVRRARRHRQGRPRRHGVADRPGIIDGPLGRIACRRTGDTPGRRAFKCTAVAGGVSYPFLGVVDLRARRVTYCKRDEPPVPSLNIPVSRRCAPRRGLAAPPPAGQAAEPSPPGDAARGPDRGEKRTPGSARRRATENPTQPLRVSPAPIRLSKSTSGVWQTAARTNSGDAGRPT